MLEQAQDQMSEQVRYMKQDQEREQELVKQVNKDLTSKEDELLRTQETIACQSKIIASLESNLRAKTANIDDLMKDKQMRHTRNVSEPVDIKNMGLENSKAAK